MVLPVRAHPKRLLRSLEKVPNVQIPLKRQLALSRNTEGHAILTLTTARDPRHLHPNHPPDLWDLRKSRAKRSTYLNSFTQILFFKLQKPKTNQKSVQRNTDPIRDDTKGVSIYLRTQHRDRNNPRIRLVV